MKVENLSTAAISQISSRASRVAPTHPLDAIDRVDRGGWGGVAVVRRRRRPGGRPTVSEEFTEHYSTRGEICGRVRALGHLFTPARESNAFDGGEA